MSVLHAESALYCAQLNKSEPFIKVSCVDICCHNGVELQNTEAVFLALFHTVQHKLFADMQPLH